MEPTVLGQRDALLAALKAILPHVRSDNEYTSGEHEAYSQALAGAKAAIAQVEAAILAAQPVAYTPPHACLHCGPGDANLLPGYPGDDGCPRCGSLWADTFMARLEAGDVTLAPTDKDYKVYIRNDDGAPFKQTFGSHHEWNPDGSQGAKVGFHWITRDAPQTKFYFQALSPEQQTRFVELYNAKRLKLEFPGHFYRLPFFMRIIPPEEQPAK